MELASARELKAALRRSVIASMASSFALKTLGMQAGPTSAMPAAPPTIALGVARASGRKNQYLLAVRIQKRELENSSQVDAIKKQAKGEVDVQYIGIPTKRAAAPWTQKHVRPLKIGCSIGHFKITAGTLGAFVKSRDDGSVLILSNNHVLANENKARKGDAILQPGAFDGGVDPSDEVGELLRFARLKRAGANLVDGAVATVDPGIEYDPRTITGIGKLAGIDSAPLADAVRKVGRTTARTSGRITAFDVDDVVVSYDMGLLRFNNQFEIEGPGDKAFSQGGDSGSLIVNSERRAVGLLFAGGDHGGANGKGLTYANPIQAVFDALKVDLFLG